MAKEEILYWLLSLASETLILDLTCFAILGLLMHSLLLFLFKFWQNDFLNLSEVQLFSKIAQLIKGAKLQSFICACDLDYQSPKKHRKILFLQKLCLLQQPII